MPLICVIKIGAPGRRALQLRRRGAASFWRAAAEPDNREPIAVTPHFNVVNR